MLNIYLVSLGCDKNTADSSKMLGILGQRGYGVVNDIEDADAAVVNTCCFIESATEESINTILELASYKAERLKYLIVAGCMAERYKDSISGEIPEVDAFIGTGSLSSIADVMDELVGRASDSEEPNGAIMSFEGNDTAFAATDIDRTWIMTERPFAEFMKIADGCDKRCTYCAIPYFKGRYKSVPMEILISEAQALGRRGVKELVLVAQETTCYGIDLYGEKRLHSLLRELSKVDGIEWIRLLYCYPEEIYDELIEEIAVNPKVLHYLDIPIQHTEDEILRRMGRRIDKAGIYSVVEKLRNHIPDICIRTSIIAGFPGETGDQHEALLDSLYELGLDHVGVFTYSREEGTPAADFPDQVDDDIKNRYRDEIMELSQEISYDNLGECIGYTYYAIVEGYLPDKDLYVARTYRDAPDVDGVVYVSSYRQLMSGDIIRVGIDDCDSYDMFGTEVI